MTRRYGPDVNTAAWRILMALDAAPLGRLTEAQLLPLLDENNRTKYKLSQRTEALHAWELARHLPDGWKILPAGRSYLLKYSDKATQWVPELVLPAVPTSMATPRLAPQFKRMDLTKLYARSQRDGRDDYRDCPSLIGGVRVAFRGAVK